MILEKFNVNKKMFLHESEKAYFSTIEWFVNDFVPKLTENIEQNPHKVEPKEVYTDKTRSMKHLMGNLMDYLKNSTTDSNILLSLHKNITSKYYGKKSIKKEMAAPKKDTDNKKKCPHQGCDKVYTSKGALVAHIKQKHKEVEFIKIEDDGDDKTFNNPIFNPIQPNKNNNKKNPVPKSLPLILNNPNEIITTSRKSKRQQAKNSKPVLRKRRSPNNFQAEVILPVKKRQVGCQSKGISIATTKIEDYSEQMNVETDSSLNNLAKQKSKLQQQTNEFSKEVLSPQIKNFLEEITITNPEVKQEENYIEYEQGILNFECQVNEENNFSPDKNKFIFDCDSSGMSDCNIKQESLYIGIDDFHEDTAVLPFYDQDVEFPKSNYNLDCNFNNDKLICVENIEPELDVYLTGEDEVGRKKSFNSLIEALQ